jgi:hypothetical protein
MSQQSPLPHQPDASLPSSVGPPSQEPPRPARPHSWTRSWLFGALGFGAALILVETLPLGDDHASRPDVQRMLVAAILVAAVTTLAMFAIITLEVRLPVSVAALCVVFNALVVGVKFVIGPNAVYAANAEHVFETEASLNETFGAWLTAVFVFVLYAAALYLIYRVVRANAGLELAGSAASRLGHRRPVLTAFLVIAAVLGGLSLAGLGLVLALLGFGTGFDYLGYVFGSAGALVTAVLLALAATAAGVAFGQAGRVAKAAQDVGVLVSLFWVCLIFLAVYHVLWVVYVLLLTSLWPLKVVTPK